MQTLLPFPFTPFPLAYTLFNPLRTCARIFYVPESTARGLGRGTAWTRLLSGRQVPVSVSQSRFQFQSHWRFPALLVYYNSCEPCSCVSFCVCVCVWDGVLVYIKLLPTSKYFNFAVRFAAVLAFQCFLPGQSLAPKPLSCVCVCVCMTVCVPRGMPWL